MNKEKDNPKQNAQGADHYVGDAQKRVLATKPWRGRDDDTLSTIKRCHRILWQLRETKFMEQLKQNLTFRLLAQFFFQFLTAVLSPLSPPG